jgi:hypothetical protein
MKITPIDFLFAMVIIALVGLLALNLKFAFFKRQNGREPKEIDVSGYYRIVKIEGREYIMSNKNLTPLNPCRCQCRQDSVK